MHKSIKKTINFANISTTDIPFKNNSVMGVVTNFCSVFASDASHRDNTAAVTLKSLIKAVITRKNQVSVSNIMI